ncbi:MAG: aminoacetone oxidase family FAD-binding enzyme [Eubacteriales bacterium]|nr:aminoacetone oxidase family FAD-binding enzyme [Eubacteriales bacterium]
MHTILHPAGSNPDIIIIGGGASGLAAACAIARRGIPAILIEKNDKLGKKLLATGNGRCNVWNTGEPVYFGDDGFAEQVLQLTGASGVRAFFAGLGLVTRQEEGGRVYPASNRADTVLRVMTQALERSSVAVRLNETVTQVTPDNGLWRVRLASGGTYSAPHVIFSGGGMAAPALGGTASMYDLLRPLGFSVVPPFPALCAVKTDKKKLKGLTGSRFMCRLTLMDGTLPIASAQGEALVAQDGISGVCAMQLGRDAGALMMKGISPVLNIDFSPLLGLTDSRMERKTPELPDSEPVLRWLNERAGFLSPRDLLTGALPRPLDTQLLKNKPEDTAQALVSFRLPVIGVRGFDGAQVTAGGVATRKIDPKTMQSHDHPGLYLTGELLNVDGDTGGWNLLFAFATGILAGESAGAV